jgi:copper chaperone CopZ
MKKQITLKITGMHCAGCSASVKNALKKVSGVTEASVSLEAATASVEYDSDKTAIADLLNAVKSAGFGAGVQ